MTDATQNPPTPAPDAEPDYANLLDHEYDGIREYDNPTPGWWTWLFVVTCIFSALYFTFFEFSPTAWSIWDQYDSAVSDDLVLQFGEIGTLEGDEATLLQYMNEDKWLMVGQGVYKGNCVSCHGPDGSGLIGPNLTDDYYKNVKKLTDLVTVIADGAANGAMPEWKNRLHPNEIILTACYVANMRGKNLPSSRAVEGEVIPPWPQP